METSVILERKINNYTVVQRTKDGYFDANHLIVQWNRNNKKRRIDRFLKSDSTKEFIEQIISREPDGKKSTIDNQAVITYKGRKTKKGQTRDKVWMHPFLFIDFAMWINPKFKYDVIKFVYDELVQNRIKIGDGYKKLCGLASRLDGCNYQKLAEAMNYVIFNKASRNQRKTITPDKAKEFDRLQNNLCYAIQMGLIKTFPKLIAHLRHIYRIENQ